MKLRISWYLSLFIVGIYLFQYRWYDFLCYREIRTPEFVPYFLMFCFWIFSGLVLEFIFDSIKERKKRRGKEALLSCLDKKYGYNEWRLKNK